MSPISSTQIRDFNQSFFPSEQTCQVHEGSSLSSFLKLLNSDEGGSNTNSHGSHALIPRIRMKRIVVPVKQIKGPICTFLLIKDQYEPQNKDKGQKVFTTNLYFINLHFKREIRSYNP